MLRPPSALLWVAVSGLLVLFLLGDAVIRSGWGEMLLLAPWPLLVLWGVYVASFTSHLRVDEDAVLVQNMLRIIRIPWAQVREMQWRWQVEFHLDDDTTVHAVGGPVQGRPGRRPGRPEQTPAGVHAQYDALEQAWQRGRARTAGATAPITRGWDLWTLGALVLLIVWAVVAVLATGGLSGAVS